MLFSTSSTFSAYGVWSIPSFQAAPVDLCFFFDFIQFNTQFLYSTYDWSDNRQFIHCTVWFPLDAIRTYRIRIHFNQVISLISFFISSLLVFIWSFRSFKWCRYLSVYTNTRFCNSFYNEIRARFSCLVASTRYNSLCFLSNSLIQTLVTNEFLW